MKYATVAVSFVLGVMSTACSDSKAHLPAVCAHAAPATQSPARFTGGGITPSAAETCDPAGSEWVACHQHMHCGPEHSGSGICGGADCESHTVYRKRVDGKAAAPVAKLTEGSVGGNCEPADHDLMVRARFVDVSSDCSAGSRARLTYCGSATGNNKIDADHDGAVTCAESGVNPTPVRWCLEARCECRPGVSTDSLATEFGADEATRAQGCPGA
jgi:hypothetical protein